jgi:hypothetical protein
MTATRSQEDTQARANLGLIGSADALLDPRRRLDHLLRLDLVGQARLREPLRHLGLLRLSHVDGFLHTTHNRFPFSTPRQYQYHSELCLKNIDMNYDDGQK